MSIAENVLYVRQKIEDAAIRAGRDPAGITLVGVTKSTDEEGARELVRQGVTDLAENRVQMLKEKQKYITDVNWHLIGHLQTNKVKEVVGNVSLIQSLDSIRLAEEIQKVSVKKDVFTRCLIEVNIFNEESKGGLKAEEIDDFLEQLDRFDRVKTEGFMSMAPLDADEKTIREGFSKMYKIFVDKQKILTHNISIHLLSMGMSHDFEYAVMEGANLVRVGRRLFQ